MVKKEVKIKYKPLQATFCNESSWEVLKEGSQEGGGWVMYINRVGMGEGYWQIKTCLL